MKPIETMYRGHRFRSRLEAEAAFILDVLRIHWVYEPHSFHLLDGTHYRPDFYMSKQKAWLEMRGYCNAHGERQIAGFREMIVQGMVGRAYVVISSTDFILTNREDGSTRASLALCGHCKQWRFKGQAERSCCVCRRFGGDTIHQAFDVHVVDGHLVLNDGGTTLELPDLRAVVQHTPIALPEPTRLCR